MLEFKRLIKSLQENAAAEIFLEDDSLDFQSIEDIVGIQLDIYFKCFYNQIGTGYFKHGSIPLSFYTLDNLKNINNHSEDMFEGMFDYFVFAYDEGDLLFFQDYKNRFDRGCGAIFMIGMGAGGDSKLAKFLAEDLFKFIETYTADQDFLTQKL